MPNTIQLFDFVKAKKVIVDEMLGVVAAWPIDTREDGVAAERRGVGATGYVQAIDTGGPFTTITVKWEATGVICDVLPDEIYVVAEARFASDEGSTPRRTRTDFVRRGFA